MGFQPTEVEWEGRYLDDHEEGTGRTDGDLSRWEHAGDLGDLEDLDEGVQRWDSTIAPFRLRGICSHRGSCEQTLRVTRCGESNY